MDRFRFTSGFTLMETIVGVAIFLVVATAAYQAYTSLFLIVSANQYKILALNLANEQFEIMRNMPYTDIGIVNGIPSGKIPYQQTLVRGGVTFVVTATVRNIDQSYDGAVSASSTDTSPADNKLIELTTTCPSCSKLTPITLTTTVAPKNLETSSNNGVLTIKAFDANGIVIPGADVTVINAKVNPNITIHDTTDVNGNLIVVDAPTGTSAYSITVTKPGYSTDRTYATSTSNPTPSKPNATVLTQQITPTSFSIDRLSSLTFSSVTSSCVPVANVSFGLTGTKLIGTGVVKYGATSTTNGSGNLSLPNMEWDTYTVNSNDSLYDIVGLSPLNPFTLNPNSSQSVQLVMASKNPRTFLVTVKDSSTQLPLTGASVKLNGGSYTSTQTTGQGYFTQTDWSGGSGQINATDLTRYATDDGNIAINVPTGSLTLKKPFSSYVSNGVLESSSFDTGAASNFKNIYWSPTDQPVAVGTSSVRLQIATATSSTATTTWTYLGPNGTSGTYYTSPGATINAIHNNDQYFRYKIFLNTASATNTPNVSDVSFTYTLSCTPPGQVVFNGLLSGSYTLTVGKEGYSTSTIPVTVSNSWKEQTVLLGP